MVTWVASCSCPCCEEAWAITKGPRRWKEFSVPTLKSLSSQKDAPWKGIWCEPSLYSKGHRNRGTDWQSGCGSPGRGRGISQESRANLRSWLHHSPCQFECTELSLVSSVSLPVWLGERYLVHRRFKHGNTDTEFNRQPSRQCWESGNKNTVWLFVRFVLT